MSEPPTCNCALLCDDVLVSQGQNKHSLMGIIGQVTMAQFPVMITGWVAYVRVSNVYGAQQITIDLQNASSNDTLFEARAELKGLNNPLGVFTLIVPIPPFVIPEPGRYLFNARHDGIPLAQSPILVAGPDVADSGEGKP